MTTKKDRRHSGYVSPNPTVPIKHLDKFHLFINEIYDEWNNYRDGMRDWFRDYKLIKKIHPRKISYNEYSLERAKMNEKQKMLVKRRKAKKETRP